MSPAKKPTLPVAIYVRVSRVMGRDVTAEGGTAAEQEKQCRAQLAADGLEVGEVFTDLDQSGGKASRPAFDQALASIEAGVHGGIIVKNIRRFGRNTVNVLEGVRWLESHGAVFLSCEEKVDTSTSQGRFFLTILAAFGEMELEDRRAGWKAKRDSLVQNGKSIAKVPFGYTLVDGG